MNSQSLEDLNFNYKELRSLIEILDQKVHNSKARAAQLGALYVIFQLIMYIQVILIPSAAWRGNWRIPFGLSASVSTAFWLTLVATVNDFMEFREQQDLAFLEQQRTYRKIYAIRNGQKQNAGGGGGTAQQSLAKAFATVRRKRYAYVGTVLSALFSFTLLVSYAVFSVTRL